MKKFVVFIIIVIIIICSISYIYIVNKANYNMAKKQNTTFEEYYQKKVYGAEVATIINKAIDSNTKNNVQKDEENNFIENTTNSIKINIKMIDYDKIYPMEVFALNGIEQFIEYYNSIQFECTQIEYHKSTNMVKSLLFEQITS